MTKVKICGLRRELDIKYVNSHKPDYAGFVFAESRRKVSPFEAKEISSFLDKSIKKVGIFVNETLENVLKISKLSGLDVLQLHGEEKQDYIDSLKTELKGIEVWKGIRVKDMESLKIMKSYFVDAYLLDTYTEGLYGGAGKTFDWSLAQKAGEYGRIILAGGLNQDNITEALKMIQPYAVDISSGVETEGYKDEKKIKGFIYSVRRNVY